MSYYVYVDYRLDSMEPFYCGIGSYGRACEYFERNEFHQNIVTKHGMWREVRELPLEADVDGKFSDEDVAFVCHLERMLIAGLMTHISQGGANMTTGGEFIKGFRQSVEQRAKIGAANYNPSPETRAKMGAANRGKKRSDDTRKRMSVARRGKPMAKMTNEKISQTMKHKYDNPVMRDMISIRTSQCMFFRKLLATWANEGWVPMF